MKKSFLRLSTLFLLILGVVFLSSCEKDSTGEELTIVEFAQADGDYDLLVDAVIRANLVDVLNSTGPFTLFAPNDIAFQTFLDNNGFSSINDVPTATLRSVLTGHVLIGEIASTQLETGYYSTFNRSAFNQEVFTDMYISITGAADINGAVNITNADIDLNNGVIHEIDRVIDLPSVVTFPAADPNFSLLVDALTVTGLNTDFIQVLSGEGPFTVFAPTNAAFEALLDSNDDWNSLADIPVETLEVVLLYHVTDTGNLRQSALTNGTSITTLSNGAKFTIDLGDGGPSVVGTNSSADIVATNLQANNGVVHVIDAVLLP